NEAVHRGVPVEYGKRLVDAEMRRTGTVVARFADGTEAEGDLLVGADGLQSRTRTVIDPDAPAVRYTGLLSTAGYASDVEAPGETGVMHLIFGKRCFFGYVKNPVGEIWWFANPPQPTELTRAELAATTSEQWRERLLQLFADDRTVAVDVIRSTDEILGGWSNYDFPTVPTWHNDRMVIVGDAAHAASPSSGQGAAMAVEDAVVLAKCLRDLPDPAAAFAAYEGLRRSRVEAVVAQGRRRGQQKAAGLVGRFVRDRVIMPMVAQRVARLPEDPNSWMYDYRIEWDAPALVS
ncbi:MAG TPA: FAD-dependent monooxygenase, partial [Micromonosporaceae bacterium]|nr:FAD-dependent monooxygenase [Micromonosporaceae bacterium]